MHFYNLGYLFFIISSIFVVAGDPTSESTTIKWKSDMNLISAAGAKQNAAGGNNDYNRTFFQWFTDNTDPAADDIAEVSQYLYTSSKRRIDELQNS